MIKLNIFSISNKYNQLDINTSIYIPIIGERISLYINKQMIYKALIEKVYLVGNDEYDILINY